MLRECKLTFSQGSQCISPAEKTHEGSKSCLQVFKEPSNEIETRFVFSGPGG